MYTLPTHMHSKTDNNWPLLAASELLAGEDEFVLFWLWEEIKSFFSLFVSAFNFALHTHTQAFPTVT